MKNFAFLLAALALVVLASCNREPTPETPEELITTLTLTMTPNDGSNDVVVLSYRDIDGDGGNAPVINTAPLKQLVTYTVEASFLNESVTPAEDITLEIKEEDELHQVFYQISGVNGLFTYSDIDMNSKPVGILTAAAFSSPGSGILRVTLRHEPNKNGANVDLGDITKAGGETDIEVEFPIVIE